MMIIFYPDGWRCEGYHQSRFIVHSKSTIIPIFGKKLFSDFQYDIFHHILWWNECDSFCTKSPSLYFLNTFTLQKISFSIVEEAWKTYNVRQNSLRVKLLLVTQTPILLTYYTLVLNIPFSKQNYYLKKYLLIVWIFIKLS